MIDTPFHLLSATEIEERFGAKYFYRQRIYRLAEKGKISNFNHGGRVCYLPSHVLKAFLKDLELKIENRFPEIDHLKLQIYYDTVRGRRIVVDGLFGKSVWANTDKETEEDLLKKMEGIREWMMSESPIEGAVVGEVVELEEKIPDEIADKQETNELSNVLPEEISWVKVDTGVIEGVDVKSYILVSLPSIAQFIGIRPDQFTEWIARTTFSNYILSAHNKQIQGTEISVPWKRGVTSGYTPLVPFELVPEIIIAFRQSGRRPAYPEKAETLYQLAKSTLEAVGLAISGDKDRAAQELAIVGKGLGLTVADQIVGIFKQYESRDYQIQTNKEFKGKIKEIGADYAITTGQLTLGITNRLPGHWKLLGTAKHLPSRLRTTGREVMRQLSPSDSVGVTFGEKHFTKDPNIPEAIETGKQGKDFYERLKNVGLLDN